MLSEAVSQRAHEFSWAENLKGQRVNVVEEYTAVTEMKAEFFLFIWDYKTEISK